MNGTRESKFPKRGVAGFILGFGVLAAGSAAAQDVIAVANGVNMWDGQWHVDAPSARAIGRSGRTLCT